ncbi:hypothetical protein [Gorillibacterium sp. sgz5001074]|uniref:hypothetical protein n=1 Tax=Gorillibacterium sp. sgz5001074 TaxID=3446695 RepID=UPI003F66E475
MVRNANMQVWADDFRKMVEIDERDKEEIHQVMDWISRNTFWQRNILSPDKLRRQYSRVCIEMADSTHKGGQGHAQGSRSGGYRRHASGDSREGQPLSISDQELTQLFAVGSQ